MKRLLVVYHCRPPGLLFVEVGGGCDCLTARLQHSEVRKNMIMWALLCISIQALNAWFVIKMFKLLRKANYAQTTWLIRQNYAFIWTHFDEDLLLQKAPVAHFEGHLSGLSAVLLVSVWLKCFFVMRGLSGNTHKVNLTFFSGLIYSLDFRYNL